MDKYYFTPPGVQTQRVPVDGFRKRGGKKKGTLYNREECAMRVLPSLPHRLSNVSIAFRGRGEMRMLWQFVKTKNVATNRNSIIKRGVANCNCLSIFKIDILTSHLLSYLNFTKLSEAIRWPSYTYLHILKRNCVYFQRIGRLQRWVLYPSCSTPPNEGGGVKVLTEAQPSFYFQ